MKNDGKKCPMCDKSWDLIDDLLNDQDILFKGYLAAPNNPSNGLFIFTHARKSCGTTFAVKVSQFEILAKNSIEIRSFTPGGGKDCEGHCMDIDNLKKCSSKNCYEVYIRDLIQLVKQRLVSQNN